MEEGLEVIQMVQRVYADGSWWMIGCECAIYQGGRFRLGPLAVREANSRERFTRAKNNCSAKPKTIKNNYANEISNGFETR